MELFFCQEDCAADESETRRTYKNLQAFKNNHANGFSITVDDDVYNPYVDGDIVVGASGATQQDLGFLQGYCNYCAMTFYASDGVRETRFFKILRVERTYRSDVFVLSLLRDNFANFAFKNGKIKGRPVLTSQAIAGIGNPIDYPIQPKISNTPSKLLMANKEQTWTGTKYILISVLSLLKGFKLGSGTSGLWTAGQTIYTGEEWDTYEEAIDAAGFSAGATELIIFAGGEEIHTAVDVVNMYIVPSFYVKLTADTPFPIYLDSGGVATSITDLWLATETKNGTTYAQQLSFVNAKTQNEASLEYVGFGGVGAYGKPLMFGTPSTQVLLPPTAIKERVYYKIFSEKSSGKMSFFCYAEYNGGEEKYLFDFTKDFSVRATYNAAAREQAQTETSRGLALLASTFTVIASAASQNYAGAAIGATGIVSTLAAQREREVTSPLAVINGDGSAEITLNMTAGRCVTLWDCIDSGGQLGKFVSRYGYKYASDKIDISSILKNTGYVKAEDVCVAGGTQEENDAFRKILERGVFVEYIQ